MIDPKLYLIHLYPLDKSPEGWTVGGWDGERGGGWTSTATSAALNTTDPEVWSPQFGVTCHGDTMNGVEEIYVMCNRVRWHNNFLPLSNPQNDNFSHRRRHKKVHKIVI